MESKERKKSVPSEHEDEKRTAPSENARKKTESEADRLKEQIEKQQRSIEELEAKNSRLRAEFHNFKTAVARETKELVGRIEENLLFKLLGLYEDLERALDHTKHIDEKFLEGVRMIYKRMLSILQEEGIQEIKPETGKPFDPFLHEVSETVVTETFDEMAVIEVEEKGYSFKSKVLKPARVVVAVKPRVKKESEGE